MKKMFVTLETFAVLLAFLTLAVVFSTGIVVASEETQSVNFGFCERLHGLSRLLPSCREIPPPPTSTDVCPNVPGNQSSGPCADAQCIQQGGTWSGTSCVTSVPLPTPAPDSGRGRDNCDRYTSDGRIAVPTVCQPTVKITYPNGNETFTVGGVIQIAWESQRVDRCSIGHSISPNTLDWIATDLPGTQESYKWTVKTWGSSFQNQQQKIYVLCNNGSTQVSDYSDNFFTVKQSDACPNVPGMQTEVPCADQQCIDQGGTWNNASCVLPPPPENTLHLCTDEIDNDGDSHVDLEDADCGSFKPKIVVVKIVINDDGGTATPSDFSLFVASESFGEISVSSGATTTLPHAGRWVVGEFTRSGYEPKGFGGDCANGSPVIAAGEVKTCTITNDDIPPGGGGPGGGTGGGGGASSGGAGGGGGASGGSN